MIFDKEASILKYKYAILANSAYSAVAGVKNKKLKSFLEINQENITSTNHKGKEKSWTIEEWIAHDIKALRSYFSHYHHKVVTIPKNRQQDIYNKLFDNAFAKLYTEKTPIQLFDKNDYVTREGVIFIFSLTADKSLVIETIARNYEKKKDPKTGELKKTEEEKFLLQIIDKYTMKDSHSILDNADENTKKAFVIKSFLVNLEKDLEKGEIKQNYIPENIFFNNVYSYIVDKGLLDSRYKFFTIEDKKLMANKKRQKEKGKDENKEIIITEEDKTKVYFKNNNVFIVKKDDLEKIQKIAHKKSKDLTVDEKKQWDKFKYIVVSRTILNRIIRADLNKDDKLTLKLYAELSNRKENQKEKEVNIKARLEHIIKKHKEYIYLDKTTKNQKIDIILKYVNDNLPQDEKMNKEQYHRLFNSLVTSQYVSEDFLKNINHQTSNKLNEKAQQVIREKKNDFIGLFKKIVNKTKKDLERLKNKEELSKEEKEYIGIKEEKSKGKRQFVSTTLKKMLEQSTANKEALFKMKIDGAIDKILNLLKKIKQKANTQTDYTDAIIFFEIGNYYLSKINGVKVDNILDFVKEEAITINGTEYTIRIDNPLSYKYFSSFDNLKRLVEVQSSLHTIENNIIDDKLIDEMIKNHRQKNRQYAKAIFSVEKDFVDKNRITINQNGYSEIAEEMNNETLFGRLKILRNSCFHNHILQGIDNESKVINLEGYQNADTIFEDIATEYKTKDWLQWVKNNKKPKVYNNHK